MNSTMLRLRYDQNHCIAKNRERFARIAPIRSRALTENDEYNIKYVVDVYP